MITLSFYYTISSDELEYCNFDVGSTVESIKVLNKGSLLSGLKESDDFLITVNAIVDNVSDEKDGKYIEINNAYIEDKQVLTPSLIDSIIETDKENLNTGGRNLILWAWNHKFKSILIKYFDRYPSLRKYIDTGIYKYISNSSYNSLIETCINKYQYDIFKNNHRLFTQAAMDKNVSLCEYLLEECDAKIPASVYKLYMNFGTKRYTFMWNVLKKYSERVIMD